MEAVSASKMRRAQAQVEATRPYANKAWEVITFLARLRQSQADLQPLLQERQVQKICLLLITADRGLGGRSEQHHDQLRLEARPSVAG